MNALSSAIKSLDKNKDDFILPIDNIANPKDDHFTLYGHRRMALEMLIDSVKTIKSNPDSAASENERLWILGLRDNCLISAPMCFEAVSGGDIDVNDAANQFLKAVDSNPDMLLNALSVANSKLSRDEFEIGFDQAHDYSLVSRSVTRQRPAG